MSIPQPGAGRGRGGSRTRSLGQDEDGAEAGFVAPFLFAVG